MLPEPPPGDDPFPRVYVTTYTETPLPSLKKAGVAAQAGTWLGSNWQTLAMFILAIVGGLFVAEVLSVMIQIVFFRLTGRRVFRMAPIHHHFELLGWPETKVVVRFWIVAGLLALLSLSTLKLR